MKNTRQRSLGSEGSDAPAVATHGCHEGPPRGERGTHTRARTDPRANPRRS